MISICFYQDMDDVMAFQQYVVTNTSIVRRSVMRSRILLLILIIMLDFIINKSASGEISLPIPGLIIGALGFFFFPRFYYKIINQKLRSDMLNPLNENYFGYREMNFSEDGIEAKADHSVTFVKWHGIREVESTPRYIFLFMSSQMALIIPKEKLTKSNLLEIETYIQSHIVNDKTIS